MGVMSIHTRRFGDSRGWFTESYNASRFAEWGVDFDWFQDNHAVSHAVGTLRGLHFQREPYAQTKLVRCVRGRIFDVMVDIRAASPTFRHWIGMELSADNGKQLLVPKGYAHGYLTLEPACEVMYKVDAPYAPEAESGVAWNDASIGIDWPLPGAASAPLLSEKDAVLPQLADVSPLFGYDGIPMCLKEYVQ